MMTANWQLAQFNVATALYPLDDARMRGFTGRLDEINALADSSPGFVWRLQTESGNAADIQVGDDPLLIVNMSVWESVEALFEFAYRSGHRAVMTKRRQWFRRPDGAYQVLWWVPQGHRPTVEEGLEKLRLLRSRGPSRDAFVFKSRFPPPGTAGGPESLEADPSCSGWE